MIAMPIKAGDIMGFSGDSWQSAGINLATYGLPYWGLSHIGIVGEYNNEPYPGVTLSSPYFRDDSIPQLLLFESTMGCNSPCVFQRKVVDGTQAHFIWDRFSQYKGKMWHYPLHRQLRPLENRRLTAFLLKHLDRDYDSIGAFRSAGIGFSWIESLLRKEDLSSLFCSELCAGAHDHIGLFGTRNVSRWSPNRFVRAERRKGILLKPRRLK